MSPFARRHLQTEIAWSTIHTSLYHDIILVSLFPLSVVRCSGIFDGHVSAPVKMYLTQRQNNCKRRWALQRQDRFMIRDCLYTALCHMIHSKWKKPTQQFADSIQRSIATFLEKSSQHVYELGVSCKAGWKEIPVDYCPSSVFLSYTVFFLHFRYL